MSGEDGTIGFPKYKVFNFGTKISSINILEPGVVLRNVVVENLSIRAW